MSLGYPRLSRPLTDDIFETGAYGVPTKSQNPTVFSTVSKWRVVDGANVHYNLPTQFLRSSFT